MSVFGSCAAAGVVGDGGAVVGCCEKAANAVAATMSPAKMMPRFTVFLFALTRSDPLYPGAACTRSRLSKAVGNAPRYFSNIRNPGVNNVDLSLQKDFGLPGGDPKRLRIRADFFSLFNIRSSASQCPVRVLQLHDLVFAQLADASRVDNSRIQAQR